MKQLLIDYGMTAAVVAMLAMTGAMWMVVVPDTMSSTTFAMLAALAIGAATAFLNTWRNSETTDSVGQLVNRADEKK